MKFGIDVLLEHSEPAPKSRIGLVGHPASVTRAGEHSLDALIARGFNVTRAFGPQHGMRGDKQDNMIESQDYVDPRHNIPVISLYGEHRHPTDSMLEDIDLVLFDLQDVGCRIYTYISTLKYFLEACARTGTAIRVLDRPNPAGRPVDGLYLEPGQESFVGCDELPTRHGLTVAELARWLVWKNNLNVDLSIERLPAYDPDAAPGYGWPVQQRAWINPSPNASSLNMARCFAGTVLLEGTLLSEGRGTTTPLELVGAPGFPADEVVRELAMSVPEWLTGILLRPCYFEPTFHKHVSQTCRGLMIHTDDAGYDHHRFKPFRLIAGILKVLRRLRPGEEIWRFHEYEYELDRTPIDVINGGPFLRQWVDDENADFGDLAGRLDAEAQRWVDERAPFLIYK